MEALNTVTEYLLQKVDRINVNNPKANIGGALLKVHKNYEEDMHKFVRQSLQLIQTAFTRDSSSDPAGTAKLTYISSVIGQKTYLMMNDMDKEKELPWNMNVRLGDLFIEAYYNCGFIDIYYPKIRDSSYIISATNNWPQLAEIAELTVRVNLRGTNTVKPKNVTQMLQVEPISAPVYNSDYSVMSFEADPVFRDAAKISANDYNAPLVKANTKNGDVDPTAPWVQAINRLQQTGWRINKDVYKTIIANKDKFVSSQPIEDNMAKELKRRSKAVEYGFITGKAELLFQSDVFYQYVDIDYRGRIYYAEPFLNFQGSDLARGMLQFARKKPMTEEGLWWLAVHTASCYNQSYQKEEIPEWVEADYLSYLEEEGLESISVDKFTLEDRVRWTNENMPIIIEAGRTHHLFMEAEKVISFLATCIEWHKYSEAKAAKQLYFTHLPIPIDGSNNGWQHLGAMSKDEKTGALVGLTKQDIQADFYVQTAKALYDLTDGRLREIMDIMPMKHIRKGISKRGSMTRAYSAGAQKIGENMWFDCRAEDYHEIYGITEKDCYDLAKLLIKAIDSVCPGPLKTMGYLQALANFKIGRYSRFKDGVEVDKEFAVIKKAIQQLYVKKGKTDEELETLNALIKETDKYESRLVYGIGDSDIRWITPSGFHVIYKDYLLRSAKCRGTISGFNDNKRTKTIKHVAQIPTKNPDMKSFMCGISPNFVHSMDAAHMALILSEWSSDFGAVHDSFAVHACDVDELLDITKRTFVKMYGERDFFSYMTEEITNNEADTKPPMKGNLDIQEVYDSDYFFA